MKTAATSAARFFVAMAAAVSSAGVVDAWSGGAGTCVVSDEGPAFPETGNPHVNNGQGALGSGAGGPYIVELDGTVLTDSGSATEVTAGMDTSVTVRAQSTDGSFKGVLITVQSVGSDVADSLKKAGANDPIQIMTTCPGGVSGATHTNPSNKTNVGVTMNVGSAVGTAYLTVTVMEMKQAWYFSQFELNVVEAGAPPTPSAAITDAPTAAPVGGNETLPTAAPSGAPIVAGGIMSALAAASALALTWTLA